MTGNANLLSLLPGTPGYGWQLGCAGLGVGAAFAWLTVAVTRQPPGRIDTGIHAWAVAHRGDAGSAIARGLARTGSSRATVPILVLIGAAAPEGRRSSPIRVVSGLMLAGVTGLGLAGRLAINAGTARRRPERVDWVAGAGDSAFPSGHTASATLFAAASVWALAPRASSAVARTALAAGAGGFALAVGWSRVWVGVHWPSDVLGGWLYATAWTATAVAGVDWLRRVTGRGGGHSRSGAGPWDSFGSQSHAGLP